MSLIVSVPPQHHDHQNHHLAAARRHYHHHPRRLPGRKRPDSGVAAIAGAPTGGGAAQHPDRELTRSFCPEQKGDSKRAEEYYSRAILADPTDGEILSQYAKLVWMQHRDEERASSYFQQAVQAAPHNSHVLGAYAGFLWETEDGDAGIEGAEDIPFSGAMASASVSA